MFIKPYKITQIMHSIITYMFDCCADPVVHLLGSASHLAFPRLAQTVPQYSRQNTFIMLFRALFPPFVTPFFADRHCSNKTPSSYLLTKGARHHPSSLTRKLLNCFFRTNFGRIRLYLRA